MDISKASILSKERGCDLIRYEEGRLALIKIPSQEHVFISMGASSIKVFQKRKLFGWLLPSTLLSFDLVPIGWYQCIPLTRAFMAISLIDGALEMVTKLSSIQEIKEKYGQNFSELLNATMEEQLRQHNS